MDADTLLRRLLAKGFFVASDGLSNRFLPDETIRDLFDVEFERALLPFLDGESVAKLAAQLPSPP